MLRSHLALRRCSYRGLAAPARYRASARRRKRRSGRLARARLGYAAARRKPAQCSTRGWRWRGQNESLETFQRPTRLRIRRARGPRATLRISRNLGFHVRGSAPQTSNTWVCGFALSVGRPPSSPRLCHFNSCLRLDCTVTSGEPHAMRRRSSNNSCVSSGAGSCVLCAAQSGTQVQQSAPVPRRLESCTDPACD
jgi:hypothetical protein